MRTLSLVLCTLLAVAAPAAAQTCLGAASLAVTPFQVRADLDATTGQHIVSGGFGGGSEALFAGVSIGTDSIDNVAASATVVNGLVGDESRLDREGRVRLCPLASVSYRLGPNVGDVSQHGLALAFGARLGVVAFEHGDVQIVPTFGGDVDYSRATIEGGGVSVSSSNTFGTAGAGIGFVFNRRIAITPFLDVPIGLDGSDPVFSLTFTVNFGSR